MTGRLEKCISLAKKVGFKGKTVLDIGCSDGWFCKVAQDNKVKEIYGVEPNLQKIKIAKKVAPFAKIKKGTASKLNFPSDKFDIVTLFDVIEHVPKNSEPQVFSEISRVLKPKGYLLLSTPFQYWLSNLADAAWYFGHRHYSKKKLEGLLNSAGFKIKQCSTHGGFWEAVSMWILYFSKWVLNTKMPFEEWFDIRRRREYKMNGKMSIMIIAQNKKPYEKN